MTTYLETVGNAGLVVTRRSRDTGRLVSVYRADVAGIEDDPSLPYATVCEAHNTLVLHSTRELAMSHLADPLGWCEPCREEPAR